jgi:deoxyribodipyrimidine photo-lyase
MPMTSPIDLDPLGIPKALQSFSPTREAALARAAQISPSQYARSRNALDGAVTGLSPYLTHGIISLPQVAQLVTHKHRLSYQDKLVFEWGWREFFHHVWSRAASPEHILRDMRPMNVWRGTYSTELPSDIRQGRTGVPCIDAAVRQLYATGYLHNHARMWLASYCVHLRKVHWRSGADWLYAHLLDGDLPSNHLSWQWVASSFSSNPYLFIDLSYEELDVIARESADVGAEPGVHADVQEPERAGADLLAFLKRFDHRWPVNSSQSATELVVTALQQTPHRQIEWVHPWALSERPLEAAIQPRNVQALRIGVIHAGVSCSRACTACVMPSGSAILRSCSTSAASRSSHAPLPRTPCFQATARRCPALRNCAIAP